MSTSWLTGTPLHSRPLNWPSDDHTSRAHLWNREGTSLLNGLTLHWLEFTREVTKRTVVYLATTRLLEVKVEAEEPLFLFPSANQLCSRSDRSGRFRYFCFRRVGEVRFVSFKET